MKTGVDGRIARKSRRTENGRRGVIWMPSPSSFALFALTNAIVWPGFALAYWHKYQREEERLLDAVDQRSPNESNAGTDQTESTVASGDT